MMKRYYLRFRIFLMALTLGLAGFFMINGSLYFSEEIYVDLPKVNSESVFEIITKENGEGFQIVAQGCGSRNKYGGKGSITTYRNNKFRYFSREFSSYETVDEATKELNQRISEANIIWSFTKNRVVLETQEEGIKWIDIVIIQDDKTFKILSARDLELAIEFENWLKAEDQK